MGPASTDNQEVKCRRTIFIEISHSTRPQIILRVVKLSDSGPEREQCPLPYQTPQFLHQTVPTSAYSVGRRADRALLIQKPRARRVRPSHVMAWALYTGAVGSA